MDNSKKRLYKALNVDLFIFVEDDLDFDEKKTHVLIDFARMNANDRRVLLDSIPDDDDNKQTLVEFAASIDDWIHNIDWSKSPYDDLEYSIKNKKEVMQLYNAVKDELWKGQYQNLFLRYGVGIIVPQLMEELFLDVIRSETEYLPVRIYKNYVEDTHVHILEDLRIQDEDNTTAALVLDNVVGTDRVAKQMIEDLKAMDISSSKRTYATILSTSASQVGESVETPELYVGYARKSNGLTDVHKNLVYAAINVLIQKYKKYYKDVVDKNCDLISENPQLIEYLYSMAQEEGVPGYDILQEWLSLMMNHEMETSSEFEELIKLSVCVDEYKSEKNKNPTIPNQLINAAATENYFNTVNKFCTVTSPGDIFQYNNKYYVLIGQECEYMMGDQRQRRVPIGELLSAEIIPQSKCEKLADDSKYVYINNFKDETGKMNVLKIDYSKRNFVSNEVLNLCCFNKKGECKVDYIADLAEDVAQMIQPYMIEYYFELKEYFENIASIKQQTPRFFELQRNLHTVAPLISIDAYQEEGTVLDYGIKRVSHLKSVACLYLHKMYLEYRGRIPYNTVNLTGYSAISADLCYNENAYPLTLYVKLSNKRDMNRKKDCRQLVWKINKNDFEKAINAFSIQLSVDEIENEYLELEGKAPMIMELSGVKIKLTKRINEEKYFVDLESEAL